MNPKEPSVSARGILAHAFAGMAMSNPDEIYIPPSPVGPPRDIRLTRGRTNTKPHYRIQKERKKRKAQRLARRATRRAAK